VASAVGQVDRLRARFHFVIVLYGFDPLLLRP
jgi:hypothetical protein